MLNVPIEHSDDKAHRRLISQAVNQLINMPASATTAQLIDITDFINTDASKVLGYMVLNLDTGVHVFASGATDGAVWHFYDSSTAHTPV